MLNHIRTFTGKYIDPLNPDPDQIDIEDIAHALAHVCRYGGHCYEPYSVAQHSVLCYNVAPAPHKKSTLLHDATEAYILDMPSPIKHRMPEYMAIEDNLMKVIATKFGIQYPFDKVVKDIDAELLHHELEYLIAKRKMVCWSPKTAKHNFLEAYYETL